MSRFLFLLPCLSLWLPLAAKDKYEVEVDYKQLNKHTEIDLENRAQDWVEAFYALREAHPDATVFAIIDGQSVDDIVSMRSMTNDSLVEITYLSNHGTRTRIVKAEEIEEIGHRQLRRPKVRLYWPDSTNRYEP